jgi:hypothetical protein
MRKIKIIIITNANQILFKIKMVASLINFTNKTSIVDDKWYVDTRATQYMSYDKEAFINYEKWPNCLFR